MPGFEFWSALDPNFLPMQIRKVGSNGSSNWVPALYGSPKIPASLLKPQPGTSEDIWGFRQQGVFLSLSSLYMYMSPLSPFSLNFFTVKKFKRKEARA